MAVCLADGSYPFGERVAIIFAFWCFDILARPPWPSWREVAAVTGCADPSGDGASVIPVSLGQLVRRIVHALRSQLAVFIGDTAIELICKSSSTWALGLVGVWEGEPKGLIHPPTRI